MSVNEVGTKQLRLVLVVSILASFVAFLDSSVVTVALPTIVRELGGDLATQQWVTDAYLITLGALMLIAGSLSDLLGRKKVLVWGLLGFGATSLLCAVAPSNAFLIIARALQGVAGALLVPSSLALIMAAFPPSEEGKAIGSWTAWTGIAFIVGPLLGGFLVDAASWRLIFAINVVPIVLTLGLIKLLKHEDVAGRTKRVDAIGAALCAVGLGGSVYALIEQSHYGWSSPFVYGPLVIGVLALGGFLWYEARAKYPMLPLGLFGIRNFGVGNAATASIYGGLSMTVFLVTIFVQQMAHYSALASGLALLPVTIIMFVLSPRFGALAGKYGARWFMAGGPLLCAIGLLSMLRVGSDAAYWTTLLPGVVVMGLGLSVTVAPLTAAILSAVDSHKAGIASAVNNAVARIAGLIAIAVIGFVTGSMVDLRGFRSGLIAVAFLLVVGGVISAFGIQNMPAGARAEPEHK